MKHTPSMLQGLTIQLICVVSTVIHAITFPEHGLTESISTTNISGTAAWEGGIMNIKH